MGDPVITRELVESRDLDGGGRVEVYAVYADGARIGTDECYLPPPGEAAPEAPGPGLPAPDRGDLVTPDEPVDLAATVAALEARIAALEARSGV